MDLRLNKNPIDFDVFEWTDLIWLWNFNLLSIFTPRNTHSSCSRICSVPRNRLSLVSIRLFENKNEKVLSTLMESRFAWVHWQMSFFYTWLKYCQKSHILRFIFEKYTNDWMFISSFVAHIDKAAPFTSYLRVI